MDRSNHSQKGAVFLLRILVLLLIIVTIYALNTLAKAGQTFDDVARRVGAEPSVVQTSTIGEKTVTIPSYSMFATGNIWALVSQKRPLHGEAGYELVDIPVAHGDATLPMKVARDIADELERLVNAAEADGEALMVSSAYRSLDEQQKIYNSFVAKNGKELAAVYVLPVGASEHHTGLAVDFSSLSDECSDDSDTCSLSQSAAAWLAENADRFGFIQRYPQGARPITGVGYEPWHYRYIGIPLAEAVASSDLTYEEVVERLAPGYAVAR